MEQNVNSRTPRLSLGILALVAIFAATSTAQTLPPRPALGTGQSNALPKFGNDFGLVVQDLSTGLTPTQLAQSILSGAGINVTNVAYSGLPHTAGTFSTTDATILGFSSGIVLSSGNVNSVPGPNLADSTTTANGLGGDAQLQALIPGYTVYDACSLQFDFTTPSLAPGQTGAVNFNFCFTSEEYNEYVNSPFNDVFGFFLNGQNIALLQNLTTPVSINNVNSGNPYVPGGGSNSSQYRNNDLTDGGGLIDIEMDGLTIVLTAFGNITGPGPHHIKLAIADAGDSVLDSNVFIQGASLVASSAPTFIAPTPTSSVNVTAGQVCSFQVRGVANHGGAGANVTLSAGGATFDAAFAGTPVAASTPFSYTPGLPVTGQPAFTNVSWTTTPAHVGGWDFTYNLLDNIGGTATGVVHVNVLPSGGTGGTPGVIAPTPEADVEAAIFVPTGWQIHAVPGTLGGGGTITIQNVSVEFDANFLGNAVPVQSPVLHIPALPVTGNPAVTTVGWVPEITDIGQWDFDYHMIDSFGQTFDFSLTVNVRHAVLALGVAPTYLQVGPSSLDVLRVDPILLLPIDLGNQPEVIVPNEPAFFGLQVYAQVILIDPFLFPTDIVKTSQTLIFTLGIGDSIYAPGSGLDLIATQVSELGEALPYEFLIPGF